MSHWEQVLAKKGLCGTVACSAPKLCFEPAAIAAPELSICLPAGMSPESLVTHYYSFEASTVVLGLVLAIVTGLAVGLGSGMLGCYIRHLRRGRSNVASERPSWRQSVRRYFSRPESLSRGPRAEEEHPRTALLAEMRGLAVRRDPEASAV